MACVSACCYVTDAYAATFERGVCVCVRCRFFFGSDYDDVCLAGDTSFKCFVALPPRDNSIMDHVFFTPNDLPLLDRFLFVEYESPAGESSYVFLSTS